MKLKDGLLLRQVAGQYVIVPTGERVREVTGVHYLTPGAAWLWGQMEGKDFQPEELMELAQAHFTGVTKEQLETDISAFLKALGDANVLEDGKMRGNFTFRLSTERAKNFLEKYNKKLD
jgi:hypothetical protein